MDPETVTAGAPIEAFYEPIHEDDTKETWEELEQAVEDTGKLKTEYRVKGATGDIIWVEARGEVEYNNNDEPIRMHGAIADITERKTREERLEELIDQLKESTNG